MLLKAKNCVQLSKRFVQALYITGDKALGNIKVLTPVLDIENRLTDRNELETNIKRRQLTTLNLDDLYAQWELNKAVKTKRAAIQNRQKQVAKLTFESMKQPESTERDNTVQKYKIEGETLREDLRNLRDNSYALEGKLIDNFLALPNKLSQQTPDELKVLSSYGEICHENRKHHIQYENLIDYYDETTYYLKGDAAKLDLLFTLNCVDFFRHNGFVQFSNPDFAKTILVEGAGKHPDDLYEVRHDNDVHCSNLVHLAGNGSLLSYLGFIAKLKISLTKLPVQWVSSGKIYIPTNANDLGLLDVTQSTAVQAFLAGTNEQIQEKFDETLQLIRKVFESIGIHFRVVCVPANQLHVAESHKVRIELYSPHQKQYIEVANLSNYTDYISKRLLFCYDENKIHQFPHILGATICNVTKLLAIILETNNGTVPNKLLKTSLLEK